MFCYCTIARSLAYKFRIGLSRKCCDGSNISNDLTHGKTTGNCLALHFQNSSFSKNCTIPFLMRIESKTLARVMWRHFGIGIVVDQWYCVGNKIFLRWDNKVLTYFGGIIAADKLLICLPQYRYSFMLNFNWNVAYLVCVTEERRLGQTE